MKKALLDSFVWRGLYFATTLGLNICIARTFEASESGWIYFISNNFYLILLLSGLSLDASMSYFSASKKIGDNKLAMFSISWSGVVVIATLLTIICFIRLNYISSNYLFIIIAGCAYTLGISLTNFFTSLFYAHENYSFPNIFMSGVNLLVIAVILLYYANVLVIDKEKLLYLYFLQFIFQGVGLAWLYVSYYVQIPTLKYPNYNERKLLFRFAIIALSANLAYYLINRIDYLFVEAYCTKKALGNYVQVSKMGQLLLIIPTIISSAIYPHAARGNNAIVVKLIFRTIALFVVLYILIGVISVLWSHQIFTLVFGPTFDEMYVPYLIVLPGILFLSVHILIAAYFGGNNRPFINLITTSAGLLVVLAGDLLLIKTMGIVGAALVSTLGYCTACIVSLVLFIKRTRAAWREIFSSDIIKIDTYTSLFYPKINAGK